MRQEVSTEFCYNFEKKIRSSPDSVWTS